MNVKAEAVSLVIQMIDRLLKQKPEAETASEQATLDAVAKELKVIALGLNDYAKQGDKIPLTFDKKLS